ncbi:MAG TPA: MBL fold metallo-hydrolase [Hyphomicrobiaceae bacterium]|nr:MBL fold metallo-hydrolase [Hyphomicrobiaceae bacterium]
MTAPRRANAYYQGPISDHFDGTRFFNPGGNGPRGRLALLRWLLTDRGAAWPARFASPLPADRPPPRFEGEGVRVAYVGHASFLLQSRGLNLLVDPVWSERASPVSFAGPKRVNAPAIAFDDLPKIDAVLVTHNHYDHMDTETIGRLWQRFRPRIVTPLGNDTILKGAVDGLQADAVDWGDVADLGSGLSVHAEPTQHWSARGTTDRMHALWASFVVRAGDRAIYCVGDSAFGDGATFKRVRARHPGLALALLPIGGYEPRWFMRNTHMNPQEAVAALELCGAAAALGHHWGTFHLTNEPIEQPMIDLAAARSARGLPEARFAALRPGEVRVVA